MTSKHDADDRWLATLAGQAEPDDADTRQAASLRHFLELQDEREAPLERKAAGRMARRLQAGLAAAQTSNEAVTPTSTAEPPAQTRPTTTALPPAWWSRWRDWCFPPLQGHGGHYAGAGALAMVVLLAVALGPTLWSGADRPAAAADERIALAEPARQGQANGVALATGSADTSAVASKRLAVAAMTAAPNAAPSAPPATAPAVATITAKVTTTAAAKDAGLGAATALAPGPSRSPSPAPAPAPATAKATATTAAASATQLAKVDGSSRATAESRAEAVRIERDTVSSQREADVAPARMAGEARVAAAPAVTALADTKMASPRPVQVAASDEMSSTANARPANAPVTRALRLAGAPLASAEPASGAGATASSAAAPRQQLSVPRPTDAAAQIEDLLRQQDVAYTLSINADVMSIDADVPDAKRAKLVEPLRKFRLELPADGKLRVRITPAR